MALRDIVGAALRTGLSPFGGQVFVPAAEEVAGRLSPKAPPADPFPQNRALSLEEIMDASEEVMRHIRGNGISMIFQEPMTSLNPLHTIEKQVSEGLKLHLDVSNEEARSKVVELLNLVQLSNVENRLASYPHQLSGGQRQRVMIAMALANNPSLLIADEPTTALDVTIQAQIIDLVKRLRDNLGMSLIWITHDLGIVAGLADRVNVMYAGFIVETAPINDIYENPRHPYTAALLRSLPSMEGSPGEPLESIEGMPPELLDLPQGCPFAPRCTFTITRGSSIMTASPMDSLFSATPAPEVVVMASAPA